MDQSPSRIIAKNSDNLLARRRKTGSIAPAEYQRGPKRKLAPYEPEIRQLIAEYPDVTLEELHAKLPNNDEVTVVTLHNFLKHLKITRKKVSLRCGSRRSRSKMQGQWKKQEREESREEERMGEPPSPWRHSMPSSGTTLSKSLSTGLGQMEKNSKSPGSPR